MPDQKRYLRSNCLMSRRFQFEKLLPKFIRKMLPTSIRQRLRAHAVRIERLEFALGYFRPSLRRVESWVTESQERTNFTYDLTDTNILYLAHIISAVVDKPVAEIGGYIEEARSDRELAEHVSRCIAASPLCCEADEHVFWGRRLGWYALTRALKPKIVVETGVDKGHGSVLICSALLRNKAESLPGRYYGTDINLEAGYLLTGKYSEVGEILYGDSIESLKRLDSSIDLFINDSDHSAVYEYEEYQTILKNLIPGSVILADNAHATDALAHFATEQNRKFLFFKETPKDHWYPGAGIGISW